MQIAVGKQRGMLNGANATGLLLALMLSLGAAFAASAEEPGGTRLSQTRQAGGDARETGRFTTVSTDNYAALRAGSKADKEASTHAKPQANQGQQESAFGDFWFYSVDVELFNDIDRDGYYHGIDILFDADTIYAAADVYAVAYLSYEGGPWNEYAISDDFTLFGSSSADDYVLVTELLQGYPKGRYDVLLELYDADTGIYLASVGPAESPELWNLPLEDSELDYRSPVPATTAVTRGGGGASSTPFLVALLGALLLSRRRPHKE